MKKFIFYSITLISISLAIAGCGNKEAAYSGTLNDNKKTDVVFVGPTEQASGFKTATVAAKTHYDLMRAARKAEEVKDYDRAISLLNEALSSAEFKFEKAVVYMTLAEMYAAKNDLENELKYRLLDAENSGNEIEKQKSLARAKEIRQLLAAKAQAQNSQA